MTVTTRVSHKWLERKPKHELASIIMANLDRIDLFAEQSDKVIESALISALEKAYIELNEIHARDGVPWTGVPIPMPTDVLPSYFTSVVEECRAALVKSGRTV